MVLILLLLISDSISIDVQELMNYKDILFSKFFDCINSGIEAVVFESCWCLTSMISLNEQFLVEAISRGCIPLFNNLLTNESEDIREQAVWGVGNIACAGVKYRDMLLSYDNLFGNMLQNLRTPKLSMLRNGSWTLSNLTNGSPLADWKIIRESLK